jgi:hypothetical protein
MIAMSFKFMALCQNLKGDIYLRVATNVDSMIGTQAVTFDICQPLVV